MNGDTRSFLSLASLPLPVKALFSAYLLTIGIGYLIAVLYLFLIDVEPHREMGMSVLQGTIHKYYGRRRDTRLEGMVRGSMGTYLTPAEKEQIFAWVESGATAEDFPKVKPVFDRDCIKCHSPTSGLNLIPLTKFEEVKRVTRKDLGESVKTLARVSHVHLFGISLIFLTTGLIFVLSSLRGLLKSIVVVIPFAAILMDIGSWWITKIKPVYAYTVIIGGALMGLSLAVQIFFSLYDMWLKKRALAGLKGNDT
ncbi:MAG: hypothetical protein M0Z67_02910 [Nitrospiraceae bacterium]|nr:hypothetical protein [Nitrospiraceae bacterium]